jgi:hypothetical protein
MKRIALIFALLMTGLVSASFAQNTPALLPKSFGGWTVAPPVETSKDAAVADPSNAAVLREYGFTDLESATYARPGRKITIKAARFQDASGAFGAYTFYRTPNMLPEKIGDNASSLNDRILFFKGNVLVQATLDQVTAMSAAELRELASALPVKPGPAQNLPPLLQYVPRQGYVERSTKYLTGPVALNSLSAPVSADAVEFNRGAEALLSQYKTGEGSATLMLISYPTPAIAGNRLRAVEALNQNQAARDSLPRDVGGPLMAKRTGPLVAVVSGQISGPEAKSLLASVNYDADVTWNENTFFDKKNNVANLLVNVILLIAVIFGMALVAGLAFGGLRVIAKRVLPGRVFDRADNVEIIELKIGR